MPERVRLMARALGRSRVTRASEGCWAKRLASLPLRRAAPQQGIVQGPLVVVLGAPSRVVDGHEPGHQHPVLVDVIGPRRRLAHEQAVVAEARGPGRHGLAPQHRTPDVADAALGLGLQRRGQRAHHCGHGLEQVLGLGRGGDAGPDHLGHLVDREADQGRHGAGHVERARQPVPDLDEGVGLAVTGRHQGLVDDGHTASSTPSTSEMVRWASDCSGGSSSWATVRYRVVARLSSMPSNWGRK